MWRTGCPDTVMTPGLLLFVGLIYLMVAAGYADQGRWGMFWCFIAYAGANIGLAFDAWR